MFCFTDKLAKTQSVQFQHFYFFATWRLCEKNHLFIMKKRNYFAKYEDKAKQVLTSLLEKYADAGIENIENMEVLTFNPFNIIRFVNGNYH